MQVMILEEDPTLRTQIAGALAPEGVDILSFGSLAPAKEAARRATVDVLVLGESVGGRLAHDVALLAEWRNPRLGAILLSDREGEDSDELFELIPSLQAVLARRTGPRTLARVALAAARSQEGGAPLGRQDGDNEHAQGAEPLAESAGPSPEEVALAPDAPSEILFTLPSFLRADEGLGLSPEGDCDDDASAEAPHPAMLPLRDAAPLRRLHLA